MLYTTITPTQKRATLREQLERGDLLRFPGAFNPLSARLVEDKGFEGAYISGAVVATDLGLPGIGLTTATEVAERSQQIARMTDLPAIVDADTGFGEPLNVARTVQSLEDAGIAGLHIEDQVNPKRCGHLEGKTIVDPDTAHQRILAAVDGRRDPNLVVIARTDIRAVAGVDAVVERAQQLADAGADVIFPVSLLRIAMGAAERALDTLLEEGTLESWVPQMQHRARLYELVDYAGYNHFDSSIHTYHGGQESYQGDRK